MTGYYGILKNGFTGEPGGIRTHDLLIRLQNAKPEENSSVLDLITSLSSDELRSVMTSCLNHTEVLLPAGPHPVMTGSEWGYPELKHDTVSCMKLVLVKKVYLAKAIIVYVDYIPDGT